MSSPARSPRQLELFPDPVVVESADPRAAIGPRTRVRALYRVRIGTGAVHLVFDDRHGWYCEEHGPGCPAVAEARARAG